MENNSPTENPKITISESYQPYLLENEQTLFAVLQQVNEYVKNDLRERGNKFHTFQNSGLCYVVAGGYARDKLLGKKSKDIDLIVKSEHLQTFRANLDAYCKKYDIEIEYTGSNEGGSRETGQILTQGLNKGMRLIKMSVWIENEEFELDLRETPNDVDLAVDAGSRDFSINSIFMVVKDEKSIFYFVGDGETDMNNKILSCHNSFEHTFGSDPSRFLRFIRFKVNKGLSVDPELDAYVRTQGTPAVQGEYFFSREFDKAFSKESTYPRYCQELVNYGILPINIRKPNLLKDPIIEEKMNSYRKSESEIMSQATRITNVVEMRILVFITSILKLQEYGPGKIAEHFKRLGKRSFKRHRIKEDFKKDQRTENVFNYTGFVYAHDMLWGDGSFAQDFSGLRKGGACEMLNNPNPNNLPNYDFLNLNEEEEEPTQQQLLEQFEEPEQISRKIKTPFDSDNEENQTPKKIKKMPHAFAGDFSSDEEPMYSEKSMIVVKNGQGLNFGEREEEESDEDDSDDPNEAEKLKDLFYREIKKSNSRSSSEDSSEGENQNMNAHNILASLDKTFTKEQMESQKLTLGEIDQLKEAIKLTQSNQNLHLTTPLIRKLSLITNNRNKVLRDCVGALIFGAENNTELTGFQLFERLSTVLIDLYNLNLGNLLFMSQERLDGTDDTLGDCWELVILSDSSGVELGVEEKEFLLCSLFSEFQSVEDFDQIFGEGYGIGVLRTTLKVCRKFLKGYLSGDVYEKKIWKLIECVKFAKSWKINDQIPDQDDIVLREFARKLNRRLN